MSNLLDPLVSSVLAYFKWTYDVWFSNNNFNFRDFFKKVRLCNKDEEYPKVIKIYTGIKGKVYLLTVPPGLNEGDFKKHQRSMEIQLGEQVEIRNKGHFIEIETIEIQLPTEIKYRLPTRAKGDGIKISIGRTLEGEVVLDLKENPHTYIVGTTGSGKSICTKVILTSVIDTYSPGEVEIYLCDLKRVELNLFSRIKHCKKFVYTVEDTTEVIADLLAETNRRYDLFMEHNVTSIFEYNKIPGVRKLKYQILYIEEIVMLLEDNKKKAKKLLKRLIAISRASGLYVFLTTQRPSNDIIDNVVKANINNRIVFKCEDSKNSIVALDQEGAETLRGRGHGFIKRGANIEEFQGYFITDNQVKEVTRKYISKEPIKEKESIDDKIYNKERSALNADSIENKKQLDLSFLD
ncbi:MAG: DNA translocase FtsK [Peptostreptococcaceae bacterium]|nr:DNA translocase FtsK [Peptostreptococcaceae bacterium]